MGAAWLRHGGDQQFPETVLSTLCTKGSAINPATSPIVIPNPLAPSASGVRDLLFAFRSGGLQFTLSLEGPGARRQGFRPAAPSLCSCAYGLPDAPICTF